MVFRPFQTGLWALLTLVWGVGPALGQLDIAQWLNPGPLAQPHETLEGVRNCTECHATAKGVPDSKCLDCHTEIQTLLKSKHGYHARQTDDCIVCHSDHKGRDYDITGLTRIQFDHAESGWPLTGKHKGIKCEDCHKNMRVNVQTQQPTTRRTYIEAPRACIVCHPDVHSGQGEFQKCSRCHLTGSWVQLKSRLIFNHNRESRYPLTGKHDKVKCYDCHKKKVWAPVPFDSCENCHADPHKGKFGPLCEKCHNTRTWKGAAPIGTSKDAQFDHNKTKFPLAGRHRDVSCKRCHGSKIEKMKGFEQCRGCHNNPHGDEFQRLWSKKKDCNSCHLTEGWTILNFRHNEDSRYKLEEAHTLVPCEQCHSDRKYRWLASAPDCNVCHLDVHNRQFEKACAACHTMKGFSELSFEHNRDSPFPLVGKHQRVACGTCHVNGRFKPLERMCQGCHNDFHNKELGSECTRCHAPIAFNDIEFDHSRGSRFRLDGEHVKNACNQCHKNYKYKIKSYNCSDCHLDVHKGDFGTKCERCHTTQGFMQTAGFHDFGEFTLEGAHDRVECLVCHGPKAKIRLKPTQCSSCHRDPHMNSFGNSCYTCHSQHAWLPTTFRHNQTGFELSGAHRFLSCDQCHFNRVFGGLPQECNYCHGKDFSPATVVPQHANAPNTCDTCHFTFGWRPAR